MSAYAATASLTKGVSNEYAFHYKMRIEYFSWDEYFSDYQF